MNKNTALPMTLLPTRGIVVARELARRTHSGMIGVTPDIICACVHVPVFWSQQSFLWQYECVGHRSRELFA